MGCRLRRSSSDTRPSQPMARPAARSEPRAECGGQREAGRGGEERRGAPRGCPALGQRGDAWRSGASRTHVSRRGDRPASLHIPGGPALEPTRERDPSASAKGSSRPTQRSLSAWRSESSSLGPGVAPRGLRGFASAALYPPRLTPYGSKSGPICTWFSCGFHLESQGVQ